MRDPGNANKITRRPPLPLLKLLYPFQRFFQIQAASGLILLACTVIALVWANSPFGDVYRALLNTELTVQLGSQGLTKPVLIWINDGLMAVFFFVVGLEIKREIIGGELADRRRRNLPIAGALGGMVVPALIYVLFNYRTPDIHGWGVPMATDIAFAIGVMALLGARAPSSLKVFLTALAIVDDIGAVIVIALFYGHSVVWSALGVGIVLLLLSAYLGWIGMRTPIGFAVIGVAVWLAFLKSGIHSTVAGVLLALTIPVYQKLDVHSFRQRVQNALNNFPTERREDSPTLDAEQQAAIAELERACEEVQNPLQRMEHILHPWVSFGIMPLFALANAGVHIAGIGHVEHMGVPLGVSLGLLIGKPLGIAGFTWLATRWDLAEKPAEVSWRQIAGAGFLGGIGFTMALFIASLAFADPDTLAVAKLAILGGSLVAGFTGYYLLRYCSTVRGPMPGDGGAGATSTVHK